MSPETNLLGYLCKMRDTFAQFLPNLEFIDSFSSKSPILNFTNISPLRATLIYANGRTATQSRTNTYTDTRKVLDAFRDYTNAPIQNILSTSQLSISQKALEMLTEDGNIMPKHVGDTIHN
jgi:hypothetical protein